MSAITTSDGAILFYKDWGARSAQPIVFHHGWPLSADDWDNQMLFFLEKGYRVIAHDRRGHGRSSQIDTGHTMDRYAEDMAELAAALDLKAGVLGERADLSAGIFTSPPSGRSKRAAIREPTSEQPCSTS